MYCFLYLSFLIYKDTDLKYTHWSETDDNVDMVMGITNVNETGGVISTRLLCLQFLSRSIPFFPMTDVLLKPREKGS